MVIYPLDPNHQVMSSSKKLSSMVSRISQQHSSGSSRVTTQERWWCECRRQNAGFRTIVSNPRRCVDMMTYALCAMRYALFGWSLLSGLCCVLRLGGAVVLHAVVAAFVWIPSALCAVRCASATLALVLSMVGTRVHIVAASCPRGGERRRAERWAGQ
jgi:hypothetical protein